MPPPPVTPSPHRFVIKKERVPPRSTPLAQEHNPRPSTQQFNATPRFTFSSTPRPTASQTLPRFTPSAARYLTPASRTPKHHDVIEEPSSSDGLEGIHESIEKEEQNVDLEGYDSEDFGDDYKLEEPSSKRRRLSTSPAVELEDDAKEDEEEDERDIPHEENFEVSSSLPILSSPPAPAPRRPISATAPRFLLSTSTPASQSTPKNSTHPPPNTTSFLKPPRFRPPDPSEASQTRADPLPEQFSPHRRGQKYVAGGLAAEVRDWLIYLEGTIPSTREKRNKDDEWAVKIVVDEVRGSLREGMTLVRGRQVHVLGNDGERDGEMADMVSVVKVILAGEGAGTGLHKGSIVEIGKTVGLKGPLWEVVIDDEKWGVGVEWKVLA